MAATIRDITKITGLSLATVSKYLNGGNVLPQNRAVIESAIKDLQYEVNEVARGLATNKTKTIGVLVHNIDNIFAGTIITHIEDLLRQNGYGTIISDCRGDKELEAKEVTFLLGKRVDGIITIPTASNSAYLDGAIKRGIPVVLIDRAFEENRFDSILVDNVSAAYQATKVLLNFGHEEIGIICGHEEEYTARERYKGYKKALEETKTGLSEQCIPFLKKGSLTVEHGYQAMKELLAMENRPTAIFLSNYEITLGAIIAINELGLQFPEEISLIGFDNMMLSQIVKPKLWMIVQPMKEIATQAAEIMLKRLSNTTEEVTPMKISLSTSILSGNSISDRREKSSI